MPQVSKNWFEATLFQYICIDSFPFLFDSVTGAQDNFRV